MISFLIKLEKKMITCSDDLLLSIIKQTICDLDNEHYRKVTELSLTQTVEGVLLLLFGLVGRWLLCCIGCFFSNQLSMNISEQLDGRFLLD